MRQRLGLARALVHNPELLILDEPTNGLDPRGRRMIHDLLLELAEQRGMGILLCTHLLDDVERLCSRIGIIDHGRTVLEGPLSELLGQQQLQRRFRLRIETRPQDPHATPPGIALAGWEGNWCHVVVGEDNFTPLPALWEDLLAHGWKFTEIHAEGGGLEELYLRLTTTTGDNSQEETA
jgi:ABC-2 type transport system ATP-binding protein